jgi:hypothetical protein
LVSVAQPLFGFLQQEGRGMSQTKRSGTARNLSPVHSAAAAGKP